MCSPKVERQHDKTKRAGPYKGLRYTTEQTKAGGLLVLGVGSVLKGMLRRLSAAKSESVQLRHDDEAFAAVEAFYGHWNNLPKNGGLMPHLRDYLDHPQPDLQPGVAIVDLLPGGKMNVRLVGTKRAALFGKDLTHKDPMIAFSTKAQKTAAKLAKGTVSQPCGNRGLQSIKTSSGRLRQSATMAFPLQVDDPDARCFVHFQRLMGDLEFDETAVEISTIDHVEWIDIGAGVPSESPV